MLMFALLCEYASKKKLYTANGLIVWYVSYISIKLLCKKKYLINKLMYLIFRYGIRMGRVHGQERLLTSQEVDKSDKDTGKRKGP